MLDNHRLVLQLSKRKAPGSGAGAAVGQQQGAAGAAAAAAGGSSAKAKGGKGGGKEGVADGSTKVVVRNVAFEATKK